MNEKRNELINESKTNKKMHELTDEELAKVTGGNINYGKCPCECDCCHVTTCCVDGSLCECGGTFKSVKK